MDSDVLKECEVEVETAVEAVGEEDCDFVEVTLELVESLTLRDTVLDMDGERLTERDTLLDKVKECERDVVGDCEVEIDTLLD